MKLHIDLKERGYDIVMERGVLHRLAQEVDLNRNVLLVSDSKVPVQWIDAVKEMCIRDRYHRLRQHQTPRTKLSPLWHT